MIVLWITNITFPEVNNLLNNQGTLKDSGGWLLGASEALTKLPNIDMTVATVSSKVKELTCLHGERITYYLLPYGKGNYQINHEYEPLWKKVNEAVRPDIVHIHGTEYSHGLSYIEACGVDNVCVSIQGLLSAYPYYYYGLSIREIYQGMTLKSMLRGSIKKGYKGFKQRANTEKELLKRVNHIIGRTSWDRSRTWAINPQAKYYYCGETLRNTFYKNDEWKYEACNPHSIFLSQASYPIKGLHMVLKALPLVLTQYPDTILRVAGSNIANAKGWHSWITLSNYGRVIQRLINRYKLNDVVTFTGPLDAEEMKSEYMTCNVFICPSSIENSPNSLGEAQILGVPVLASYAGGIPDMMTGCEACLYRFEETEMLAYKICEIFEMRDKINTQDMRNVAKRRHDPKQNLIDLMKIYNKVIKVYTGVHQNYLTVPNMSI